MVIEQPFWMVLAVGAVAVPLGLLVQRFPWLRHTFKVIRRALVYVYLIGAVVYVAWSYARL